MAEDEGLADLLSNDNDFGIYGSSVSSQQKQCQRNMLLLAAEDRSSFPGGASSVLIGVGGHLGLNNDRVEESSYVFVSDELADLHDLAEVSVDSDEDDSHSEASSQFGEVASYLSIFDMLSKVPGDRSVADIDTVLEYVQHLPAFSNLSLSVRRKLCGVMTLETFRDAGTVIIRSGEEIDSWWVVFGGSVEQTREGYEPVAYHLGECFGISRGAPKKRQIQTSTVATRGQETILLRVAGEQFHQILSQLEEETINVEEDGKIVLVTEYSEELGTRVAVRGTAERLLRQLLRDDEHPLYSEDFLLGYRTFTSGMEVATKLGEWFESRPDCREKVARTILLWVNNHIDDFDGKSDMVQFLEVFQNQLQEANMFGELRLLTIALQRRPSVVLGTDKATPSPLPGRRTDVDEVKLSPRVGRRTISLPFGKKSKGGTLSKKSGRLISGPANDAPPPPGDLTPAGSLSSLTSLSVGSADSAGMSLSLRGSDSWTSMPGGGVSTVISPTLNESGTIIKVYRHDHSFRYVVVTSETTADALVRSAHKQFDLPDGVKDYSLCRLTVTPEGIVKQTRLPPQFHNLPSHLSLTSRYYLKSNTVTMNLVHGEQVQEILQEGSTDLLSFEPKDVARAVTLQDFSIFCQISPVEYIEDLWGLPRSSESDSLQRFSETTNREMFWVATEILKEPVLSNRVRLIKHFIKIAKYCRKARNYNTMFAITSGLSYGAVTRLRHTWERVGSRHIKAVEEMQQLMNPSRNMYNYRRLASGAFSPMIPFFPVVKKDVTFMYLGNDNTIDDMINFEKLRMIAKEIRTFCGYHRNNYVPAAMFGGQTAVGTLQPRPSRSAQHDQWLVQRRLDHYLANLDVITDEAFLKKMASELVEAEQ